jgi:hypothetical protein
MRQRIRARSILVPNPPLLVTESADEFESMSAELEAEIQPRGYIERMYAAEIACIVWEIQRWRRSRAAIINAAFNPALERLLRQLLAGTEAEDAAEDLAYRWFTNAAAKEQVAAILGRFGLDESAIEAQAIRQTLPELEQLDKMVAMSELRRDRALLGVAEYRDGLARRLRQGSDRMIAAIDVPRLEDTSSKKAAAA